MIAVGTGNFAHTGRDKHGRLLWVKGTLVRIWQNVHDCGGGGGMLVRLEGKA